MGCVVNNFLVAFAPSADATERTVCRIGYKYIRERIPDPRTGLHFPHIRYYAKAPYYGPRLCRQEFVTGRFGTSFILDRRRIIAETQLDSS